VPPRATTISTTSTLRDDGSDDENISSGFFSDDSLRPRRAPTPPLDPNAFGPTSSAEFDFTDSDSFVSESSAAPTNPPARTQAASSAPEPTETPDSISTQDNSNASSSRHSSTGSSISSNSKMVDDFAPGTDTSGWNDEDDFHSIDIPSKPSTTGLSVALATDNAQQPHQSNDAALAAHTSQLPEEAPSTSASVLVEVAAEPTIATREPSNSKKPSPVPITASPSNAEDVPTPATKPAGPVTLALAEAKPKPPKANAPSVPIAKAAESVLSLKRPAVSTNPASEGSSTKLAELSAVVSQLKSTNAQLLQQNQSLADQITQNQSKADRQQLLIVRQLRHTEEQYETLQQTFADYKQRAQQVLSQKEELVARLLSAESANSATASASVDSANPSGTDATIAQQQTLITQLKSERETLRTAIDQVETALDELRKCSTEAISAAEKERATLNSTVQDLEEQLGKQKTKVAALLLEMELKAQAHQDQVHHLQERLRQGIDMVEQREAELARAKRQLLASASSSPAATKVTQLEEKVKSLSDQLIARQLQIDTLIFQQSAVDRVLCHLIKANVSHSDFQRCRKSQLTWRPISHHNR